MRRTLVQNHALSLVILAVFVATILAESFVGHADHNAFLAQHGMPVIGYGEYVSSSHFVVDVAENWQSEFLQFLVFIFVTVWFVERGSPESKQPGDEGIGSDADQLVGEHARYDSPKWAKVTGWRRRWYSNSLMIVMGGIFVASWLAQSLAGTTAANLDARLHGEPELTWGEYVLSPDFWNRSVQNWQSEFLAVGAMIVLSIYLRQRGSSESKPVGMPHHVTSVEST